MFWKYNYNINICKSIIKFKFYNNKKILKVFKNGFYLLKEEDLFINGLFIKLKYEKYLKN